MITRTRIDLAYAPAEEGERKRRALMKVKNLTLKNAYRGSLQVGQNWADVRIETDDVLRVRHRVESPPSPVEAMQINGRLPGNVRYAIVGDQMILTTDTRIDGEAHLRESFREIAFGFASGSPGPAIPTTWVSGTCCLTTALMVM